MWVLDADHEYQFNHYSAHPDSNQFQWTTKLFIRNSLRNNCEQNVTVAPNTDLLSQHSFFSENDIQNSDNCVAAALGPGFYLTGSIWGRAVERGCKTPRFLGFYTKKLKTSKVQILGF